MTAKVLQAVRYDDEELDEDELRKVKEELGETDDTRRKCLESLKKKLLSTSGLNPNLEEWFLLAYLRVSKYDCNKAYQRIIAMFNERFIQPYVYEDYLPSTVKLAENGRQLFASPYRARDNSCIIIMKRLAYDPFKLQYEVIVRACCLIADILIHHPLNQLFGFTLILDLKSSSWVNWSEYTPSRLKMIARMAQKAVPARIRSVHILNAPPIYNFLYSIMYPFLSSKIRNRIFLHKSNSSLHDYLDPETLSKEYGGYLEHAELINLFHRIYAQEDFFSNISKYGFIKKV